MQIRQSAFTPLEKAQTARPVRKEFSSGLKERSFLTGFTVMEMIIVVIMISTLSAIGWPSYTKARIKAENKEAFSILFLLQSAEKNYKLDSQGNTFYPPPTDSVTDVSSINSNLNVHLSETATRHWNYTVYSSGCVQVTRKNDGTRVWHLNISISDYITPVSGACS